jgi:hypothetical protein
MAMKAAVIGAPMVLRAMMVLVVNVGPMRMVRPVGRAPVPIGLNPPDRRKVHTTTRATSKPKLLESLSLAPGECVSWSQPTRSPGCSNEWSRGYDCANKSDPSGRGIGCLVSPSEPTRELRPPRR